MVVRALALNYDQRNRYDDAAVGVYARATHWLPEERGLWIVYGRALVRREDYSESATDVYEKAIRTSQPDESISLALARAYVANNAYDGPRRPQALLLWETLFRQGQHWPRLRAPAPGARHPASHWADTPIYAAIRHHGGRTPR
jgi:predicted Zn-dependent protease